MKPILGASTVRAFANRSLQSRAFEPMTIEGLRAAHDAEAIVLPSPTRFGPLMSVLSAAHDALRDGGLLVVSDLVWQTAPSPDLALAFAPAPGAEKIRPIEGYEMQIEHSGFEIIERHDLASAEWVDAFVGTQREALAADARGAAKVAAWLLGRID